MKDWSRARSCHGDGLAEGPLLVKTTRAVKNIIQRMAAVGARELWILWIVILGDDKQRLAGRIPDACVCNEMHTNPGNLRRNDHLALYLFAQVKEPKSGCETLQGSVNGFKL